MRQSHYFVYYCWNQKILLHFLANAQQTIDQLQLLYTNE